MATDVATEACARTAGGFDQRGSRARVDWPFAERPVDFRPAEIHVFLVKPGENFGSPLQVRRSQNVTAAETGSMRSI